MILESKKGPLNKEMEWNKVFLLTGDQNQDQPQKKYSERECVTPRLKSEFGGIILINQFSKRTEEQYEIHDN